MAAISAVFSCRFGSLTYTSSWVPPISGEKRESREEGEPGGKYHLVERSFGSFRRSFTLPRNVRADGITADFENGLLTVRLPKAEEAVSRKIEVSRRS